MAPQDTPRAASYGAARGRRAMLQNRLSLRGSGLELQQPLGAALSGEKPGRGKGATELQQLTYCRMAANIEPKARAQTSRMCIYIEEK